MTDLLQPLDSFAILVPLDSNMSHRRGGRSAVPMCGNRRNPQGITGADILMGFAPLQNMSEACRYR